MPAQMFHDWKRVSEKAAILYLWICHKIVSTVILVDLHLNPPFCSIVANNECIRRPFNRAGYKPNNSTFLERVKEELYIEDIKPMLTTENYKEKFHKLLCWEEMEHITLLHNRLGMLYLYMYMNIMPAQGVFSTLFDSLL